MASISGTTSSLGNTSLRGYGGFATGIDRDAVIEQATAATTGKITTQKNAMTSLTWKQEAYRSVSDKILDLQDNFFSYSAGSNLKNSSFFSQNQITTKGDSDYTKYVSATGTSSMVDYLAIQGVKQLASAATTLSGTKGSASAIGTNITTDSLTETVYKTSNLKGTQLKFGTYDTNGAFKSAATFTFPATYKDESDPDKDGNPKVKDIDYTADPAELVEQLNKALKSSNFKLDDDSKIEFALENGQIQIKGSGEASRYVINDTSSALKALGYNSSGNADPSNGISLNEFNTNMTSFEDAYVTKQNMKQYLTGKTLSVTYGGQTKTIDLLKAADVDKVNSMDDLQKLIQERLDKAFGSGKVFANLEDVLDEHGDPTSSQKLTFTAKDGQNLTINSNDVEVRKTLGIVKNASNTVSLDASLWDNREKLGFIGYDDNDTDKARFEAALKDFKINGTAITGLTSSTTVNGLIDKINGTKDVGVKASYLSGENQFVLLATDTGSGRKINLGDTGSAADTIFGGVSKDGEDAIIAINYGNGVTSTVTSSSNTFDLEGLKVTVTNTFGYKLDSSGNQTDQVDPAQAVTFSASADVDGVTEQIKKFIEAYNEMATEIYTQVTTKPNSTYGPLTDAQKEEMTETSIENWETAAKKGLLYSDSTMRELSSSLQNVFNSLLSSGVTVDKLEEIGLSIEDGWRSGGTIAFDENKFKAAMTSDPELVSNIFTGGGDVSKGLMQIIEDTLTPYATKYATRNGNSYGRLIEEAGSEKIPLSISDNQIYRQLEEMQKTIDLLNTRLKSEQDRYISKFTTMETLINKMNSQSSYLSSI